MLFKNKKGEVASIILLVIVILVIIGYGIKVSGRQCNSNIDCKENYYCGSDFKCHEFRTVTVYKYDLLLPAIILAIALIVGAVILKKQKQKPEYQENPYYE